MAVTINVTADTSQATQAATQLSANLSTAFAGVQNQLNQMATASGQASAKMTTGLQGLSQQVIKQVAVQGDLSKSFLQTGQAAQTQLNQFEKLRQQYLKTQQATDQFAKGLSLIRTTLSAFGVTAGIAGVIQFTRSIVDAGLQMERFERQLITATGSATSAAQAFQFITAESNRLGQSLQTMVPIFVQLTAATRGTTLEGEKTRALFSALAGAGVAVGLSTEATGRAMVGLIQIISQNAIQLDEFRNQFASQIPGAMRETAKALGEMGVTARGSITEMLSLIEKGKLPVEDLMTAVTKGLQEVQAAAPAMADSVEGAFNRFSNDVFQLKADIARSGLLELLGKIAKAGGDALFRAGQALGLSTANISREAQLAEKDLALVNSGILEYMEVAERARKQGLVPETELEKIAELTKRRDALIQRLQDYQDQLQAAERAQKTAAEITSQQNKDANDEEKRFFEEKKQREAALKAAPGVLQAEGAATAARLKGNLDAIKQNYADQRQLAIQFAQEQLQAAPRDVAAISEARQTALDQIAQREAQAILAGRKILADQELKDDQRVLAAKIKAAGDAQDQIAVLRAQEPLLIAKHAEAIADIRADQSALEAKTLEKGTDKLTKELEKRLKEEERFTDLTQDVQSKYNEWLLNEFDRIADANEKLDQKKTRDLERELDKQQRAYKRFGEQVVDFLDEIFQGLLTGTLKAVDFFKNLLIRQLSNIAANVLGPLVTSLSAGIVSSVVGGVGGGGSGAASGILQAIGLGRGVLGAATGSTGGSGLGALQGLGLLASLKTIGTGFMDALSGLTDTLVNAGSTISTALGGPAIYAPGFVGPVPSGAISTAAGTTGGAVLGAAGGLAALGGGIYAAINASNAASRAAFAASAAAGAAATATAAIGAGLLGASAATAVGTGWTGVGLIVAAVMAVIGVVLDKVIKPEGPSLSVRAGGGLGIGVQDGKLAVEGGVGSRATRREGVDRQLANTVAQQLDEGITNAVKSIVQTINAVALDPAALLGPTQAALQQTLRNLQPINSANAKKMEKDIQEQLRFANLAIVGGLLEPVNLAFDQLRDQGDLKEQLDRLPGTTAGLVAVFKTMNQQLDEIGSVQNTDVLRQLSGVRNQVENFGNRISGTAGQIAESIVNQLVDELADAGSAGIEQVRLDTGARFNKTGAAVDDLDRSLAEQITDFSEMMQTSARAITILRNTKDILEQSGLGGGAVGRQIDRLAMATGDAAGRISKQIVTTALTSLADDLDQLLLRPLQLQTVGVNSLFNDGLATLAALQVQWNQLSALGIDTKGLQEQFSRLLGGLLESAMTVLNQAFAGGTFAEFLSVLVSIPDDLARLNPQLAQLKQLGLIFAQVVAPMDHAIMTLEDSLLTTAERVTFTETRMADLRSAIADAGNAVDQALPLYAALSEAIQANAAAQIASVNEVADAQIKAAQESADTQIQAVHDAADAHLQWINTVADAQIAAINASSDALTEGVSAYFDAAAEQLRQFVEELTTAINTWADVANTTAGQLRTVNETILAEQSPAAQQRALLEQEARLLAMATGGGAGSQAALSELISVEQQLLALAKRSNNLKAQQDSLDKLTAIQNALRDQLVALTGQSDPIIAQIVIAEVQKEYLKQIADFNTAYGRYLETTQGAYLKAIADQTAAMVAGVEAGRTSQIDAVNASATAQILSIETARDAQVKAINESRDAMITAIKVDVINQLKAVEGALQHLFEGQDVVNGTLHVPFTVRVAPAGAYAQGGMVGAMLEPGERVFNPPFAGAQEGALVAMNRAFPRFAGGGFTVPGRGTGDTVPMMLPRGSFVMNRRAAGAMGYQGGGMVSGSLGGHPIVVNIDLRGATVRNQGDYTRLTTEFREAVREALREIERRSPKRGG